MSQPSYARAWLRQRELGAEAVARLEDSTLRALDDATALIMSEALLAAAPLARMDDGRRETSGFVDQQRLFAAARR